MQLTADEWRQLLMKLGIQPEDGDIDWLASAGQNPPASTPPRAEIEPQLVQRAARWEAGR